MTTMSSPPAAGAPRKQGAAPGRVVAIVAAVFLLLVGVLLAVGGTVLMATFGTDGEISSSRNPVATPTAAVVTDITPVRDASEYAGMLGDPVANAAGDGGNASGLFVGIGPAVEVDEYLAGVEIDQAVDFELDPYVLDLSRRAGAETNAEPPTEQDFWLASADSTTGLELSWPIQDGDYRMVVMNADGAAGVESQLSVGLRLGSMFGIGLGMLIGGGVMIILAIVLLVATRPRRLPPTAPALSDRYAPPTGNGPLPATVPPVDTVPPAREPLS